MRFHLSGWLAALPFLYTMLSADEVPRFEPQTIDAKVAIGYGTVLEDVDGDGKLDILLADKKQFVWYRNPDWQRFVIAENLTERDNVCIAARDLDGDGRVEIAVGAQWNPGDTENSGAVFQLVAPEDRTKQWKAVELHHEPVVHRMRWVRSGDEHVLVVAPLHGRGNRGGNGVGVRLLAYHAPQSDSDSWETELLEDTLHVTHNFDRGQWVGNDDSPEEIVYLGREGAVLLQHDGKKWSKALLVGVGGGGEIRMGEFADGTRFLATIEPFHGEKLMVYEYPSAASAASAAVEPARKQLLDDNFQQGHAIATGDLIGTGEDQIVAGWRNPNRDGKIGVKLYYRSGDGWKSAWIDDNQMACEDLRLADLDGDGRIDVVAAGRSTHNLKVYWNKSG